MPETDETPQLKTCDITLAGAVRNVPQMRVKDITKLWPLIMKFGKADLSAVTEENMNDLAEIGFLTLRRLDPDLKREQYDEMPVTFAEIIGAVPALMFLMGAPTTEEAK